MLAPLAGITNHAFRLMCREFGAGAVYTEMISSCGIHFGNTRTREMFDWTCEESPVAVQIFGADPLMMADAAKQVENAGADIIDINMGCPVPKVRKTGAGSAMMDDYGTARAVISSVVKAVSVPVTIKTRKGLHEELTTAVDIARIAEDEGASAVAVHGRTAAQGYAGTADWTIIREVKQSVGIPVIGNGDVRSAEDAVRMIAETGCDAVMVGRGALGNPWIFRQIKHFMVTGESLPEPSIDERIEAARDHLHRIVSLHGEDKGVKEMRGQLAWYIRGVKGASHIRGILAEASTLSEMESALMEISLHRRQE